MITANYDVEERRKKKMKSDHRVIPLKPMEGKRAMNSTGTPDPRLFNGENKLHAQFSFNTGMWKLNYDVGSLPGGLQSRFTSFPELLEHTRQYFAKRNIAVGEVQDVS